MDSCQNNAELTRLDVLQALRPGSGSFLSFEEKLASPEDKRI